jgi:iron complex outermembrane receptor protein
MLRTSISLAALIAALAHQPAFAEEAAAVTTEAVEANTDAEDVDQDDEKLIVRAVRRPSPDVLGGARTIDTEELAHDLKPSLGDTLADMPGVSASSFGPSSSRPILRGLAGEDAPILIDGITSLDLSSSDPDHAVTINPLTAESIEVLRGPGTLVYNSAAIGGVVNVIDSRIPRRVPADFDADVLLNYGTAANERSGNVSAAVPLGGRFVAHADGSYTKYDDLQVGGHLLSAPLRREALASADPDVRALADLKGKLPNTAGKGDDLAGGLAYVDGDFNLGLSYSHHDSRYGVPIRFSLDPDFEPEAPTIDAHQDRLDGRVNIPIGGFLREFEFRGGLSKYHHAEIEDTGEIGSRFKSNGGEMRADVIQTARDGWGGTSGLQYLYQDFSIRGDEKYLPDSDNRKIGLFTLQTLERGAMRLEGAVRIDFSRLRADADAQIAENGGTIGTQDFKRSFAPVSASVGGNYDLGGDWRIGLALSHSERAPNVQELFSNGPLGGSAQFLVGDPDLKTQKSNGAELSLTHNSGPIHVQGSIYYNDYSNYIFEAPTGEVRDGLPVYSFLEGQAKYYGFEIEAEAKFGRALGINWSGELTVDAVRAKIKSFGDAPAIPPFRLLAGISGERGSVTGRVEVEKVARQSKTAPEELPTSGYTMVNASFDWTPLKDDPDLTLSVTGNNLFDVEARRHASELKDYAPLAGRDIRLTARLGF